MEHTIILPENDLTEHMESCIQCDCGPDVVMSGDIPMIVHRAFDFKDIIEEMCSQEIEVEGAEGLVRATRNALREGILSPYFAGAYNALTLVMNMILERQHNLGMITPDDIELPDEYKGYCENCDLEDEELEGDCE